ncbi:inositol phosphophingolipids phospholipase C [Mycena polygramma]|nr:inositol phosphophingolipids phospholipase C [Mycena polygramma]
MSEAHSIHVLTLNCWGLKYVAKNRTERIHAIANELAKLEHNDIIALQEIWVFADYEHVRDAVVKRLPYSKFFYSGALGSGLALLSRFPIIGTSVHPYSLNGTPIDVGGGDWFVGKAAVSITVSHPILGQFQVFNTHLYAKGGEDGPEHRRAHRLRVRHAELGRYVIAVSRCPMALIREYTGLSDSWVAAHPIHPSTSSPSAMEAIQQFGVTADSPLNSYSAGKPIGPYARQFLGKRLDYILYRQPVRPLQRPDDPLPVLKCTECNVLLTDKVQGRPFSFSDHFALEATLEIQTGDRVPVDLADPHNVWSTAGTPLSASELSAESLTTTMQALAACYRFSRQRARKELSLFALCILILLALIHAWINPIFILFTVFSRGFLYGNWECNALMNVIEELEIYKNSLEIQAGTRE